MGHSATGHDSPPGGHRVVADCHLRAMRFRTVLLFRRDYATRETAEAVVEAMRFLGARIVGDGNEQATPDL